MKTNRQIKTEALSPESAALNSTLAFEDSIDLHRIRNFVRTSRDAYGSDKEFFGHLRDAEVKLSDAAREIWNRTPSEVLNPVLDLIA